MTKTTFEVYSAESFGLREREPQSRGAYDSLRDAVRRADKFLIKRNHRVWITHFEDGRPIGDSVPMESGKYVYLYTGGDDQEDQDCPDYPEPGEN